MLYFKTRQQARNFAAGKRKVVDRLANCKTMREVFAISANMQSRWAVKVI